MLPARSGRAPLQQGSFGAPGRAVPCRAVESSQPHPACCHPLALLVCRFCSLYPESLAPQSRKPRPFLSREPRPLLALQALYFEAAGQPEKAEALYKKELEADPQNAMMLKRMVGPGML